MRCAAGESTRDDADLVHGLHLLQKHAGENVPDLVISRDLLIFFGDDPAFLFHTQGKLIFCFFKIYHGERILVLICRNQRRFVHEIGEVRPTESGSSARDDFQMDILTERHLRRMNFENLRASFDIRQINRHLTIETPRTQESGIQYIRPICSRDDDHSLVRLKSVHLHQELIQRLFTLVMSTAETRPAMASNRINLIYKGDARRTLFSLRKEVSNSRRTHSHKHLYEV